MVIIIIITLLEYHNFKTFGISDIIIGDTVYLHTCIYMNFTNCRLIWSEYLSNGPTKKERGQLQRMQKGADCEIV